MRNRIIISIVCAIVAVAVMAQTEIPDSIKAQELDEVVVEAHNQRLGAEVSTYIPTSKQRNASQTAADLLNRMAIPQIKISANDEITDLAGKGVDVFIEVYSVQPSQDTVIIPQRVLFTTWSIQTIPKDPFV